MSKASIKEGTKSNVIIIPGIINSEVRDRPRAAPSANDAFVDISSFEGNIEVALKFYASEIGKLTASNSQLSLQLRRALEDKRELADLIASFEEFSKEDTDEKKKRVRRCAN
jgi:hypothetical protein